MSSENTRDLTKMGYRELHIFRDILDAYLNDRYQKDSKDVLTSGIAIEFNPNSGELFMVDGDYNVLMLAGHYLEKWNSCANCGAEGFISEFPLNEDSECIKCSPPKPCPDCFATDGKHTRTSCNE